MITMRLAVALLTASLLTACAGVSRYDRGPLAAFGEPLDQAPEPLYYLVRIEAERPADPRVMGALLKLGPEAPPLAIAALRPEAVSPYLPAFVPPPQWPETLKQKARQFDEYHGGGFYVAFRNGRLVSVGICSHCAGERHSPVVGTPDGLAFYTLPLSEPQMRAVFGAPERLRKVREITYDR